MYLLKSAEPLAWQPTPQALVSTDGSFSHSPDVKYDATRNLFYMTRIHSPGAPTMMQGEGVEAQSLQYAYSQDGYGFSAFLTLLTTKVMPSHSHNVGLGGDELGHLLPSDNIVGFGAPPFLRGNSDGSVGQERGVWDLYTMPIRLP
jgi:hypothetical protein